MEKTEAEIKSSAKVKRLSTGIIATSMLLNLAGCHPRIPNPGPKPNEKAYAEETNEDLNYEEIQELQI